MVSHFDQSHRLAHLGAQPAQRRRGRAVHLPELLRELAQQLVSVGRRTRGGEPLFEARHGFGQPLRLHRLHEIVERALGERLNRVLIVRGDEHEVRAATDVLRRLHAGQARHVDIQEADVGMVALESLDRLAAVACLRHDFELRPCVGELPGQ
jgi:hypothetical protein